MINEINEDCLFLRKIKELLPELTIINDEDDGDDDNLEDVPYKGSREYKEMRARKRHSQTNYDNILSSDELHDFVTINGVVRHESLDIVCYFRGICTDFDEGICPTEEHAVHLLRSAANDLVEGKWSPAAPPAAPEE